MESTSASPEEVQRADSYRHDSADRLNDDELIRYLQTDRQMRLTITKNFSKEINQSLSGGVVTWDESPAQRRFSCAICQQVFLHATDCLGHVYMHTETTALDIGQEEVPFSGLVEKAENLQKDYTGGENDSWEDTKNQSVSCNEVGKVVWEDNIHCKDAKTAQRDCHSCPLCEVTFPTHVGQREHMKLLHANDAATSNKYGCKCCEKPFTNLRNLHQHYKQEHPGQSSYICCVCNLSFHTRNSLSLHKCNHMGHHPFKCDIKGCNRSFASASSVKRHRLFHSEERPHVCQHCGKAFKMVNHLREHVRLHTGEKPFICEFCGAGFAQSNGLKSHAKQHSLERDNQCDICHKAFSCPQNLALHKKVHSGEKPFSCEQCGQAFCAAANLGAHKKLKHGIRCHKGEKHFTCDVCGASFSQACNLGIHKKKKHSDLPVTQEKKFVCDICQARFSEACNLGAHKKIKHTEQSEMRDNIFHCNICSAKFYRACNLSRHKKQKHGDTQDCRSGERVVSSQLCNVRCSSIDDLQQRHMKSHQDAVPLLWKTLGFPEACQQPLKQQAHENYIDKQDQFPLSSQAKSTQQSFPEIHSKSREEVTSSTVAHSAANQGILFHHPSFPSSVTCRSFDSTQNITGQNQPSYSNPVPTTQFDECQHKVPSGLLFAVNKPRLNLDSSLHNFHFDTQPVSCYVCGALMVSQESLVDHLKLHYGD